MDTDDIARRYVALWNERDADQRADAVRALFAPDAAHFTRSLEARGHAGLVQRVTDAHERWVRDGGRVFRTQGQADGHHNAVRLRWEMAPADGGPATSAGLDLLLLDRDGRVRLDYQFPNPA